MIKGLDKIEKNGVKMKSTPKIKNYVYSKGFEPSPWELGLYVDYRNKNSRNVFKNKNNSLLQYHWRNFIWINYDAIWSGQNYYFEDEEWRSICCDEWLDELLEPLLAGRLKVQMAILGSIYSCKTPFFLQVLRLFPQSFVSETYWSICQRNY